MKMIDDFIAIFSFGFPLEKAIYCRCAIRHQITINSLFDRSSHGFCDALICWQSTVIIIWDLDVI